MWRRLIAGWMVVSLVTLGVPVAASAVVPVVRRVGLVERYAGPGRDAVNWKENRFGVEQARQNQPVGVRRMLKGRLAPNAPNIRRQPPAFQPQAAAAQPTGQVRAEVQKGVLRTGIVNGLDGSRSVVPAQTPKVIGQDAIRYPRVAPPPVQSYRGNFQAFVAQERMSVENDLYAVLKQIDQATKTLQWVRGADSYTQEIFRRNTTTLYNNIAQPVGGMVALTSASGVPVGTVSWTQTFGHVAYHATIRSPRGYVTAEITGGYAYYPDSGIRGAGSYTIRDAFDITTPSSRRINYGAGETWLR